MSIKYSTLQKFSFILVTLFMVNPVLKLLLSMMFDVSIYLYMHEYNTSVLIFGIIIFIIYFKKRYDEGYRLDRSSIKLWAKKNIPIILLLVFAMFMIVTTLINGAPYIAIYGSYYRGEGLMGYLSYIMYFLLTVFMLTDRQKRIAVVTFVVSSVIIGITVFVDFGLLNDKYGYAMGDNMIFSQYNHLGYYFLISIMTFGMLFITCKAIKAKIFCAMGFVLMLVALIMNDTWGCQFAVFIGVVFAVIVYSIGHSRFKLISVGLVLLVVLTYVTSYHTDERIKDMIEENIKQQWFDMGAIANEEDRIYRTSGVSRLILWETAFDILWESPIVGHGADVTGRRLEMVTEDNDRCHCEYLNYALSFGIPAAIIYIIGIFLIYLRALKRKKELQAIHYIGLCVAFTYLASAFIGNSMFYTAPYLFIMLGLGYIKE